VFRVGSELAKWSASYPNIAEKYLKAFESFGNFLGELEATMIGQDVEERKAFRAEFREIQSVEYEMRTSGQMFEGWGQVIV
jgi:hypothetical protein